MGPGEIMLIPAGGPHLLTNPYDEHTAAVIALADPTGQDGDVPIPERDGLVPQGGAAPRRVPRRPPEYFRQDEVRAGGHRCLMIPPSTRRFCPVM